jgi:hypothetical protein
MRRAGRCGADCLVNRTTGSAVPVRLWIAIAADHPIEIPRISAALAQALELRRYNSAVGYDWRVDSALRFDARHLCTGETFTESWKQIVQVEVKERPPPEVPREVGPRRDGILVFLLRRHQHRHAIAPAVGVVRLRVVDNVPVAQWNGRWSRCARLRAPSM